MPIILTNEQQTLLSSWHEAVQASKAWYEYENKMRTLVVQTFSNAAKLTGTETIALPDGYKLTIHKQQYYNLQNEFGETDDVLKEFPEHIAKILVRRKLELSIKNFKALTPVDRKRFDAVLTTKDGMPQVELISPTPEVERNEKAFGGSTFEIST